MGAAEFEARCEHAGWFDFRPNAARTRQVVARVREGLAESLDAALRALGKQSSAASDLIGQVRAGPIAPRVFGAYTELVEAIFSDDVASSLAITNEICEAHFGRVDGLRVVTLHDSHLGKGQTARYRRLVDDDQELGKALRTLDEAQFADAAKRVHDALAVLDAGVPELAEELRALVHEIVVVSKPGDWPFGASSFQLWGALFLKLTPEASRVEIAEALAHESAHALLFGFSMGSPLVENEPDELYPSPLRSDPRPMDGVVHATYVTARMHYTATRLLASGRLSDEEAHETRELIKRNEQGYLEGLAVVDSGARWTRAGEAALASAKVYMSTQLQFCSGTRKSRLVTAHGARN
jgi:hypothetical protein